MDLRENPTMAVHGGRQLVEVCREAGIETPEQVTADLFGFSAVSCESLFNLLFRTTLSFLGEVKKSTFKLQARFYYFYCFAFFTAYISKQTTVQLYNFFC